jgi:GT2 family glycosyltransferase
MIEKIYSIAILLACHNRKDFTLNAISAVKNNNSSKVKYKLYLTDDNSTDGTYDLVKNYHPDVMLLKGDGNLFWAGGMRNSWRESLNENFDGFLLLNDDTFVYNVLFDEISKSIELCYNMYKKNGILIGSTIDKDSKLFSYGGYNFKSKLRATYREIFPNGEIQECELGNANIMFVHKDVYSTIGMLSECYIHGVADFDYTLKARKHRIPVLVMPSFLGECSNDQIDKTNQIISIEKFRLRYNYLVSPLGFAFRDNLNFQLRFFPYRIIYTLPAAFLKVLAPKLYSFLRAKFGK